MTRVAPGQRQRAKRPKTRSGCLTCKVRRVKCDESKPHCRRCTSTGRVCDGYQDEASTLSRDLTIETISSTSAIFPTSRELRAFTFFCERTCRQICGFYYCDFWSSAVLQAVHADSGIRHAILALGALHEEYELNGGLQELACSFSLAHYGKAIRHNLLSLERDRSNHRHKVTYLAACVLFICVELLQAHFASAESLLRDAVSIYNEIPDDEWDTSLWPLAELGRYLERLRNQSIGLSHLRDIGTGVQTEVCPRLRDRDTPPLLPDMFTTLSEAKAAFDFYLPGRIHPFDEHHELDKPDPQAVLRASRLYHRWSRAFDALIVSKKAAFTPDEQRAAATLQIWRILGNIGLAMQEKLTRGSPFAMLWDDFEDDCREMVELAEFVVDSAGINMSTPPSSSAYRFTINLGIVGPLWDIACNCRSSPIRRRAIAVLHRHRCREGLWDGLIAARIVESAADLEESGLRQLDRAADVPFSSRFESISAAFLPGEREAGVAFISHRPRNTACPPKKVVLTLPLQGEASLGEVIVGTQGVRTS